MRTWRVGGRGLEGNDAERGRGDDRRGAGFHAGANRRQSGWRAGGNGEVWGKLGRRRAAPGRWSRKWIRGGRRLDGKIMQ